MVNFHYGIYNDLLKEAIVIKIHHGIGIFSVRCVM